MATEHSRQKRIERAQTKVIFSVPFFAPGVCKLPVVFDDSVQTACTDGSGIRWNSVWFDKLTDGQVTTVLVHEACHCLLGHNWRAPAGCDWEQWNIACDHAVNLMLKDFSQIVMGKGLADPFPFPEPTTAYCADPRFKGMAEEVIVKALGNRPKSGQSQNGAQSGSGASGGVQTPSGASKSQMGGKAAQKTASPEAGSMPSFGQIERPKGQSSDNKVRDNWKHTLIQSAKLASGKGSLPAEIERLVGELVHPTVPWWEVLRSWLREQASDDWDFMHPDVTFEDTGFLMPSLKSERCGPIVFATDTSGSIDAGMLARFQSEKQHCLDTMRPKSVTDIYCDARIQAVYSYTPGADIAKLCPGGGGTDFRPVFNHIAEMSEPVKALVYLTDLYGTFPQSDPGIPVIWVTWSKGMAAPFGEVVYAGE